MKVLINILFGIFLAIGLSILLFAIEEVTKRSGGYGGDLWMAWGLGITGIAILLKVLLKTMNTKKHGWLLIFNVIFTVCALIDTYYMIAYIFKGENNLLHQSLLCGALWILAIIPLLLFLRANRKKTIAN